MPYWEGRGISVRWALAWGHGQHIQRETFRAKRHRRQAAQSLQNPLAVGSEIPTLKAHHSIIRAPLLVRIREIALIGGVVGFLYPTFDAGVRQVYTVYRLLIDLLDFSLDFDLAYFIFRKAGYHRIGPNEMITPPRH